MKIVENNAAGSNPNVVPELIIRGANSLAISGEQGINNPLVILDGVEISMEELYDMEINEIESVTILEDASATVLYGERAANGVILVERVRAKDSMHINWKIFGKESIQSGIKLRCGSPSAIPIL